MDVVRHLRILVAVVRNMSRSHRTLVDTQVYWQKPDDGNNNPLQYVAEEKNPKNVAKTLNLVSVINSLDIKKPKILEVGCNAGRNLNGLFKAGYTNLDAIEISQDAISVMETTYPKTFSTANIHCGPAENILSKFEDKVALGFSR